MLYAYDFINILIIGFRLYEYILIIVCDRVDPTFNSHTWFNKNQTCVKPSILRHICIIYNKINYMHNYTSGHETLSVIFYIV